MNDSDKDKILLWWSGELSPEERDDAEHLLANSPELQDFLDTLKRQGEDLQALQDVELLPANFSSEVLVKARESGSLPGRHKAKTPLFVLAAAACLMAGFVILQVSSTRQGVPVSSGPGESTAILRVSATTPLSISITGLQQESTDLLESTRFTNRRKL